MRQIVAAAAIFLLTISGCAGSRPSAAGEFVQPTQPTLPHTVSPDGRITESVCFPIVVHEPK